MGGGNFFMDELAYFLFSIKLFSYILYYLLQSKNSDRKSLGALFKILELGYPSKFRKRFSVRSKKFSAEGHFSFHNSEKQVKK